MTPQLGVERLDLLFHRIMTVLLAPGRNLLKTAAQPLARGAQVDRELPFAASPADMGETEKVKSPRSLPCQPF
jgi:hypothetical protein